MTTLRDNSRCYVCGKDNPVGLQAAFTYDPATKSLRGTFTARREHEGWQGIVHGGIIAALMDEAMVKLAAYQGLPAVSAEITIKFNAPAAPGDDLDVTARITKEAGRLIEAEAAVKRGTVRIGEARGKLLRTTP